MHLQIEEPTTNFKQLIEIGPMGTQVFWEGYGSVTLTVFRANLPPGTYQYLYRYSGGDSSRGGCTVPAAFSGTPLRNELYEGLAVHGSLAGPGLLTIPAGRSIGLQNVILPTNYTLQIDGDGAFTAADSRFGNVMLMGRGDFSFSHSAFLGGVHIFNAGSGATLLDNTFYGGVVCSNTSVLLEDNVFCSPLQIHSSGARPTVQNNSFVDRRGIWGVLDELSHGPISIGRNYFGAKAGPTYRDHPEYDVLKSKEFYLGRLLMRGGATVEEYFRTPGQYLAPSYTAISLNPPLETGKARSDASVFPKIWCAGIAAYQQSAGMVGQTFEEAILRQGRPWMISVDLRGWDHALNGVNVYVEVDSNRYDAENVPVRRDPASAGLVAVRYGRSLFNIRMPAMSQTGAHVRVYMDTTGLQGDAGSGNVTLLGEGHVKFLPSFARPLRIMVVPWEIRCPGYSTATPNAAGIVAELRRRLTTMLPLNPNEVILQVESPNRYFAGYGALLEVLWSRPLMLRLAFDAKIFLNTYNDVMPADRQVDRLIAVVPHGVLGTATNLEGQGVVFRRIDSRIAIVEQTAPSAVIHELIHTLGYSREQYEDYPPKGIALQNIIGFAPGGGIHGAEQQAWPEWAGGLTYYDVMGAGDPQWIIPHTLYIAYNGLRSLLGTSSVGGSSSKVKEKSASNIVVQNSGSVRTVLLRGTVLGDTQLVASTVAGFDRSGISTNVWRGEPRYDNNGYNFMAYDQSMNIITTYPFVAEGPWLGTGIGTGDYERLYARADGAPWQRYFDYPSNAVRLAIVGAAYNPGTYWDVVRRTNFACAILAPASDTAITNLTPLLWTVTGVATSSPVLCEAAWSTNGVDWNPIGDLLRTNACLLSSAGLPNSTTISIRVRASDGLNMASAVIHRLRVGNQAPSVEMISPRDGDHAPTSFVWRFVASAQDWEDGVLTNGVWTSSRDGVFATGSIASASLRSTGSHWIAFVVSDRNGLSASARVAVTVGTVTALDLGVELSALSVFAPGVDPIGTLDPFFEPGVSNAIGVSFRNGGFTGTATAVLRVWVQTPGGVETLAASQRVAWTAFDMHTLNHVLIPDERGVFRIRARIDALDPPDTNPANNERTWEIPCGLGHLFVHLDPAAAVAGGAQWRLDGGPWRASDTALSNLASGVHTIEFSAVAGYATPRPYFLDIAAGRRGVFTRMYEAGGDVRVTISPALAVDEGAQWRINNGTWRTNGETASGLATGIAVITYRDIPWWQTPAAQTVTVRAASLISTGGVYLALPRPPAKPENVAPTNGSRDVSADFVYFYWTAPSGFDSFRLEFSTNANLGPAYDQGRILYVSDLDYDRWYYWRVLLSNAVGITTGDIWSFKTEQMPPMIVSPRLVTGIVGHVFSYRIEAANATGWGPVGLPTWLTNHNGMLRGICPSAGVEFVELYASNATTFRTTYLMITIESGVDLAWQAASSSVTVDLHAVTFGNGQFVAVGDRGTILTSPDGFAWTSRTSTVTNSLRGIAWGTNAYVAVGFEGTVVRSTNGVLWTKQTTGISRALPLLGIGYGLGKYVAVGYEKWILNSPDGITWTERNFSSGSINPLANVALTNGVMVAAGGIGFGFPTFMRSTNADSWSTVAASGSDGFHNIAVGAGKFVAVGRNGVVQSSTNGISWSVHTPPTIRDLFGICYGEDQFATVSWTGSVRTSTTAQDWRTLSTGIAEDLYSIAYGAGRFVAVGRFGRIITAAYIADRDADGFSDQVEQRIGTNPLDPDSHLSFSGAPTNMSAGFIVRWQSVSGRVYSIYRATNLIGEMPFTPIAPSVTGRSSFSTWTDTTAVGSSPYFYRVQTQP